MEKIKIDKILVDIPFANSGIQMKVRVPLLITPPNLNAIERRVEQLKRTVPVVRLEQQKGTNENYIKIDNQPMFYFAIKYGVPNKGIYFTPFHFFRFRREINRMARLIGTKGLFWYENGRLVVDREIAEHTRCEFRVYNTMLEMRFLPVEVNASDVAREEQRHVYEGIHIKHIESEIYLTVEELYMLAETLNEINLTEIGLQAIQIGCIKRLC